MLWVDQTGGPAPECDVQQGLLSGTDDGVFLDAIIFEHMVDKSRIELFNKVVHDWDIGADVDMDEMALD